MCGCARPCPTSVLDQAEIELVDLTPDELRERLHEGKVYVPEQASRALDHYFSPGNLTALRELALRRTAERVDDQMVQYMRAHGLAGPWAASEHLLACVHGGEGAAELVRYTKRLADRLKAPWTAIHIQTAGDRRAGEAVNDRVADTLRLAERLGGEALVLPGQRIADEVLAWARANNVTQIIIGSVRRSGWRELLGGSLPRDLIRGADDITVPVLPEGGETAPAKRVRARPAGAPPAAAALSRRRGAGRRRDRRRLAARRTCSTSTTSRWSSCCRCWRPPWPGALARRWRRPDCRSSPTTSSSLDPLYTFHDQRSRERRRAVAVLDRGRVGQRHRGPHPRPDPGGTPRGRHGRRPSTPSRRSSPASPRSTTCSGPRRIRWRGCSRPRWCSCCRRTAGWRVMAAYPPEDQLDDNDLAAAEWCWRNDTPAGRGLGQPAGSAAPVPPLAHRPRQARRSPASARTWPARC